LLVGVVINIPQKNSKLVTRNVTLSVTRRKIAAVCGYWVFIPLGSLVRTQYYFIYLTLLYRCFTHTYIYKHYNGLSAFLMSTDYPLRDMVGCYNLNSSRRYDKIVYTLKETIDSHRCFYICNERGYMYAAVNEYILYYVIYYQYISHLLFTTCYIRDYNWYRDHCECSNETPSADDQKDKEDCRKCVGDKSEYCGGPNSISIYKNDWFG